MFNPFEDKDAEIARLGYKPVSTQERIKNILTGVSRWLMSRSGTSWATKFGHSHLMKEWSGDILKVHTLMQEMYDEIEELENRLKGGLTSDPFKLFEAKRAAMHASNTTFDNLPLGDDRFRHAALAILADLAGREVTKEDIEMLDADKRIEIVESISNIIQFSLYKKGK
jgi:hypothetical protein